MARRNKYNRNDVQGVYDKIRRFNKWKNRLVLGTIIVACTAVIVALVVVVLGSKSDEIIAKYETLSGAPSDSKQQFALHNVIITYDDNGKLSIEIVQGNKGTNASLAGVGDSDPGTPDSDGDVGGGEGEEGGEEVVDCDAPNHNEVCTSASCVDGGVEVTSTSITYTYPYDIYYYDNGNRVKNCVKGDYGMSRLFSNSKYISVDWSDGSLQEKLCDTMKASSEYNGSKDFATYKGYPLTAAAPHVSALTVGSIIRVTYLIDASASDIEYQDWVVVDIKAGEGKEDGNPNVAGYVWGSNDVHAGHYMLDNYTMDILEPVRKDNTNNSSFNAQFNKNYTGKSRIIRVEVVGSVM